MAATSKWSILLSVEDVAARVPPGGGSDPAAGPGGAHAVPVQNHACRTFQVLTALVAATAVSGRPTPRPTATVR